MPIEPTGKNDLSSLKMFLERRYYKNSVYPDEINDDVPQPIDLWYEKPLYGRVNPRGEPIHSIEGKLKQFDPEDPNIFGFNFVVDSFKDFRSAYLLLNKKDPSATPFEFLRPRRAWENPVQKREEYLDQLYKMFVETYLSRKKRYQKIRSFNDFLSEFVEFMNFYGPKFPVTMSNFMLSNFSSPMSSGLMVEIAEKSYDDDEDKYTDILTNQCFTCYVQVARRFGFKVDKNIPWRLVADINSPFMQKYMKKYAPVDFRKYQKLVNDWNPQTTEGAKYKQDLNFLARLSESAREGADVSGIAGALDMAVEDARLFVDLYNHWKPTTLEGKTYKDDLGRITFGTPLRLFDNASKYFTKTYESDIDFIKEVCTSFYYSYVANTPVFSVSKFSPECGITNSKAVVREQISKSYVNARYSDTFWINYYIKILMGETQQKISNQNLRSIISQAQTITKQKGIKEASKFVYSNFQKKVLTSFGKSAKISNNVMSTSTTIPGY